jgi:hypothetical protein
LLTSHLDGSLTAWGWTWVRRRSAAGEWADAVSLRNLSQAADATGAQGEQGLEQKGFSQCHARHATRLAWTEHTASGDGTGIAGYLASASSDRSIALFQVGLAVAFEGRDQTTSGGELSMCVKARRLQQLYFKMGAPEAIAWAPAPLALAADSAAPAAAAAAECRCLVAAVRGSPTLYYISVVSDEAGCASDAPGFPFNGQRVPLLCEAGEPSPRIQSVFVHRVPISEDGSEFSLFHAAAPSATEASAPLEPAVGAWGWDVASSTVIETHVVHSASAGLTDAEGCYFQAPADSTEGGFYIPVGFGIIDLAIAFDAALCKPWVSELRALDNLVRPPFMVAAAADNGVVFMYKFGTNKMAARLVGHLINSNITAATRIRFLPLSPQWARTTMAWGQYIAVTSDSDHSVVVYSVGSERIVAKLGGNGGHTAAIKDIQFLSRPGTMPPCLISSGLDKRLICWI